MESSAFTFILTDLKPILMKLSLSLTLFISIIKQPLLLRQNMRLEKLVHSINLKMRKTSGSFKDRHSSWKVLEHSVAFFEEKIQKVESSIFIKLEKVLPIGSKVQKSFQICKSVFEKNLQRSVCLLVGMGGTRVVKTWISLRQLDTFND